MADPIEIKIVGKDDSEAALKAATRGIKGLGDESDKATPRIKGSGDAAAKAATGIKGYGDEAAQAETKVRGFGDGQERINKFIGDGGRQFGDYGKGLGGVGDRFDELDTRSMGVADGFAGLTDAMKWNQLTAQEQAMVFSDMGSAMYNAVIPSLQSGTKAIKGLVADLGGIKSVLVGGGAIAAMGGLAYVLHQNAEEARNAHFDEIAEDLAKTGDAAEAAADALGKPGPDFSNMISGANLDVANLHETLTRLVKDGNFDEANDLIREAGERGDITAGQVDAYSRILSDLENSSEGAAAEQGKLADSIRGTSDAIQAATDPVFAMIDADNQLRDANQGVADAQRAVLEAVKEHGEGSAEHVEALQNLRDAQLDAASSAYDQEAAMRDLAAATVEGGGDVDAMTDHLRSLEDQGIIAKGTTDAFARAVRDIPRRTNTTITATDRASTVLKAVGDRQRALDGSITDIFLQASWVGGGSAYAAFTGRTRAAGGPTSAAAAGGPRRDMTLVGEHGPEFVDLPPGTMVHPAANTGQMAGGWGGGLYLTVNVAGHVMTERDLFDVFRDIIRNNYGGNVDRALGWP